METATIWLDLKDCYFCLVTFDFQKEKFIGQNLCGRYPSSSTEFIVCFPVLLRTPSHLIQANCCRPCSLPSSSSPWTLHCPKGFSTSDFLPHFSSGALIWSSGPVGRLNLYILFPFDKPEGGGEMVFSSFSLLLLS